MKVAGLAALGIGHQFIEKWRTKGIKGINELTEIESGALSDRDLIITSSGKMFSL